MIHVQWKLPEKTCEKGLCKETLLTIQKKKKHLIELAVFNKPTFIKKDIACVRLLITMQKVASKKESVFIISFNSEKILGQMCIQITPELKIHLNVVRESWWPQNYNVFIIKVLLQHMSSRCGGVCNSIILHPYNIINNCFKSRIT